MPSPQSSRFVPAVPIALACALLACAGTERTKAVSPTLAPALASSTPAPAPAPASSAQAFAPDDPAYGFADPDRKRKLKAGFAALDMIAIDEMAAQKLPGLALGVVIDGELAYENGFGFSDLDKKTKPDADTIFRIGSITKSVTGLAILSLRDDGALALDDPLARHLREAAGLVYPTTDAAPITLRQLLAHKSGLPGMGAFGLDNPTEATILASLASFPLENAPGVAYQYSNLGFSLLGIVVARAGRAPFREIVSARILRPLGMTSTVWDRASVDAGRGAKGYVLNEVKEPRPAPDVEFGAAEATGGLFSSVRDMARYVAFQLAAYPPRNAGDGGPIRRSSVREAHASGFQRRLQVALAPSPKKGESLVTAEAETYGFGWEGRQTCDFDDLVSHAGMVPGYTAHIAFLRERGVGVVAMANGGIADLSRLTDRVLDALRNTAGLVKRSRAPSPSFEPAMKKLLDVYNAWDDASYRSMLRPGRGGMQGSPEEMLRFEKEELAGYKKLHGLCKGFSPIEVPSARDATFKMDCERGPFEMKVTLTPDGKFIDGFVGISRDASIPKDLRTVAERVAGLVRRWDDAVYKKHLSKSKKTRDQAASAFESLRSAHGACTVKSSTMVSFDRKIELGCERGGGVGLVLEVDPKDPTAVVHYEFGGESEAICPMR